MTLENLKENLLRAIADEVEVRNFEGIEVLTMTYNVLCSTETMCKCPTREEERNPFE